MANTLKAVHSHIAELLASDVSAKNTVKSYYDDAMTIIKGSLQAFFTEYATESGLDFNTVSQQANSWDLSQFNRAISVLLSNTDFYGNSDLDQRLKMARIQAKGRKKDTLAAIINAGMAIATAKTQKFGHNSAVNSYIDEYNYTSSNGSMMTTANIPKDVAKQTDLNNRVWVHGDLSAQRTSQTLSQAIKSGIDNDTLRQLTKDNHDKPLSGNLDAAAQAGRSFNQQLVNYSNIKASNQGRDAVYKNDSNVNYVKFVTEEDDKVCDICAPLDGNVYALSDAPIPQNDTHINCRCQLVSCDADGNLL